ncbi:MAG: OmpA family protein [Cyclobacteriaceae bacterium]
MHFKHLCYQILFTFVCIESYGQCDYAIPAKNKRIAYAKRIITFSDVSINGKATTFLAVEKGAPVTVQATIQSEKGSNYCPNCIVQIYWGIRGHASICAKSFHGYQFNQKKTIHRFNAPTEEGIYYLTMGGTLDYSCKNNVFRPACSPDDAFAVIKVGNPDPEEKVILTQTENNGNAYLQTSLVKQGCFGELNKTEWFLDGTKLPFDDQKSIPLTRDGIYQVNWYSCLNRISASFNYKRNGRSTQIIGSNTSQQSKGTIRYTGQKSGNNDNQKGIISIKGVTGSGSTKEETDLEKLIEKEDKFVLKNLVFDLRKATIRPEAKQELNKLAEVMLSKPSMKILLEGHTDRRGGAEKNLQLSEQRVKSVKEYLKRRGIKGKRVKTKGWGDQKPLLITDDVEKGKINRRVEITVLKR